MSLQQLLAEHSRDISANLEHTQEMAQDNVSRKANDLEEKFQHAKDSIEGLGGEIASAGMAYHMGRKIYQKYQSAKAARAAKSGATRQTPEEERTGFGNQPGDEPKNTGSSDGAAQSSEGRSAADDGATGGSGAEGEVRPTPTEDAGANPTSAASDEIEHVSGSGISDADEATAQALDDSFPNAGMGDEYRNIAQRQANRSQELQNARPQQEGVSGEQTAPDSATQGGTSSAGETSADAADASHTSGGSSDVAGDISETTRDEMSSGRGTATSDLGNEGATSAAAETTGESAAADAEGIGAKAFAPIAEKTGIEAGLETASGVLDALGPVGEGIGLITSLVGLFEGIGHHKKEITEQAETGATTSGIDTSALTQKASVGVVA